MPGLRLGPYEIVSAASAGGMGEVPVLRYGIEIGGTLDAAHRTLIESDGHLLVNSDAADSRTLRLMDFRSGPTLSALDVGLRESQT